VFFRQKTLFDADNQLILDAIRECKRRTASRGRQAPAPVAAPTPASLGRPYRATYTGIGFIETARPLNQRNLFRVGGVSLTIHASVIVGAVYATLNISKTESSVRVDTTMVLLDQQQPQKPLEPQPVQLDEALKGFQTVVPPVDIPADIPPVDIREHFDVRDYSGQGFEGGLASGRVPSAGDLFDEDVVQERPSLVRGPPLIYPQVLLDAGIEGRVVVEAVIDTLGRVEPKSLKIVSSANPGFVQAAKNFMLGALFRPGRMHGLAVRVLVNQPVEFNRITNGP
jgi:TonB family protein